MKKFKEYDKKFLKFIYDNKLMHINIIEVKSQFKNTYISINRILKNIKNNSYKHIWRL